MALVLACVGLLQEGTAPGAELPALGYGAALIRMIVALLIVCVAAYLVLRGVRRFVTDPRRRAGAIDVIERCPLAPRQCLWLVRIQGRILLIGGTEHSLIKLAELDGIDVKRDAVAPPGRPRFVDLLRGRGGRRSSGTGDR